MLKAPLWTEEVLYDSLFCHLTIARPLEDNMFIERESKLREAARKTYIVLAYFFAILSGIALCAGLAMIFDAENFPPSFQGIPGGFQVLGSLFIAVSIAVESLCVRVGHLAQVHRALPTLATYLGTALLVYAAHLTVFTFLA